MNINVTHTTYSDFPPIYFMELDKIEKEEQYKIENDIQNKIHLENEKRPPAVDYSDSKQIGIFISFIGIVLGIGGACTSCNGSGLFSFAGNFFGALISFILGFVIGPIIGGAVAYFIEKSADKEYKLLNESVDEKIENLNFEKERLKEELSKEIQSIKNDYTKRFEDISNTVSIEKFAGSKLLEEKNIVNWIMDNFGRYIDMAQREKHIKNVEIVYQFNVFTDKITCSGGTFDFNIQRCPELTSAIEQTALAMAIATELKIRTVMTYPKDVKDKDAKVSVKYSYTQTNVQANLIYTAVNGNYEPVGSW